MIENNDGSLGCKICPVGTYQIESKTRCELCPGRNISAEGSVSLSDCSSCPPGYWTWIWVPRRCIKCEAGTYEKNNTCVECPKGTTSLEASTECVAVKKDLMPYGIAVGVFVAIILFVIFLLKKKSAYEILNERDMKISLVMPQKNHESVSSNQNL